MKPKFEIDENVIVIDCIDDKYVYMIDNVIQIIISKNDIEYLFENVSRPIHEKSKKLLKFSFEKEQELKNNGYIKIISL